MTMPPCPHRPPCPGCPRFGEPGLAPAAIAALTALCAETGAVPPAVTEGPPGGWRLRARLAVRGRAASPKLGIFQTGSHRIVDVPQCLVHHPRINAIGAAVKAAIRSTGTPPYADRPHLGALRYIQVVVERASARAQVVLVGNADTPAPLAPLADALLATAGEQLHSLWWNGNPTRTNAILGPHWRRWHGPAAVEERIGGARVFFPPGAFGQSNLDLADHLVATVQGWVPDGTRVVELYAGAGAIGLGLAGRVRSIACNEVSPAGLEGLALGRDALEPAGRDRVTVLPGPASDHVAAMANADVVIADPPRKGLDASVLAALVAAPPPRLILVSCSLDAFLREARALAGSGRTRLSALVALPLFPHTEHVETAALFERRP